MKLTRLAIVSSWISKGKHILYNFASWMPCRKAWLSCPRSPISSRLAFLSAIGRGIYNLRNA